MQNCNVSDDHGFVLSTRGHMTGGLETIADELASALTADARPFIIAPEVSTIAGRRAIDRRFVWRSVRPLQMI
jgi:hypothetical protein